MQGNVFEMAQQDYALKSTVKSRDILGNCSAVICFLRDVTSSRDFKDELSDPGQEGLAHVLDFVNDELLNAVNILEKSMETIPS